MRYVYSVIRFVPDSARGEFINIGVIAGSDLTGEWDARTVGNLKRARYLDDAAILGSVVAAVERVSAFIDRASTAGEPLLDEADAPSQSWLARLASDHKTSCSFRGKRLLKRTILKTFSYLRFAS